MAIRSKPANDRYRKGFDAIKWPKRGRTVLDRANRPAENRGGRARLFERKQPTDVRKMSPGMLGAARVLSLAESPRERDMFRSLLKTDGNLSNPSEIKDALREVQIRRGG